MKKIIVSVKRIGVLSMTNIWRHKAETGED